MRAKVQTFQLDDGRKSSRGACEKHEHNLKRVRKRIKIKEYRRHLD